MPFASFRNIQKRYARAHKERSQPEHRKHLGLLHKKKDFVLRARDREKKQNKLREMRKQALTKNSDEFYFNMCNSAFDSSKGHIPINTTLEYSPSALMKGMSLSVCEIRLELQKELSKIRRLEASANLLHSNIELRSRRAMPRHIFFAETKNEASNLRSRLKSDEFSDTHASDLSRTVYEELNLRTQRAETLKLMLKKREAKQKLMTNHGRKYRTVTKESKSNAPVYQFEAERAH